MNRTLTTTSTCLLLALFAAACGGTDPYDQQPDGEGAEPVDSREEELGGTAYTPDAEAVGVVKVQANILKGSGVVLRSWWAPTGQGALILTARHTMSGLDVAYPGKVMVTMGTKTATGVAVTLYPTNSIDIALIRVNRALPVNGAMNFTRSYNTEDYGQLAATMRPLNCYGYGETAAGKTDFGTLRWGWFYATTYLSASHQLLVSSYPSPWFATLQLGDSGGPCVDQGSRLAGIVHRANQSYGGGTLTAMDGVVRTWIANNTP